MLIVPLAHHYFLIVIYWVWVKFDLIWPNHCSFFISSLSFNLCELLSTDSISCNYIELSMNMAFHVHSSIWYMPEGIYTGQVCITSRRLGIWNSTRNSDRNHILGWSWKASKWKKWWGKMWTLVVVNTLNWILYGYLAFNVYLLGCSWLILMLTHRSAIGY